MAPIEEIFCEIDDFCALFFPQFEHSLLSPPNAKRQRRASMSASEMMTIVVLFHLSHYRDCVQRQLNDCFPKYCHTTGLSKCKAGCLQPFARL